MSDKVAEIPVIFLQDSASQWVSWLWNKFNNQRVEYINEVKELRDYTFATDTTKTSNHKNGWKNSTTMPKICQIRDNLHSNYLSSVFPNDDWLKWQAHSKEDATRAKAETIESYMDNKTRMSHYRTTISKCLYDYIDYGNAFITSTFESKYRELADGTVVPDYIGPKAVRISPMDVVFNPTATSFDESFKIIRSIKTIGEIKKLSVDNPDESFWQEALERREVARTVGKQGGYSIEDFDKAVGYSVDGFGNMYEYFMSDFVEILEFYGDYHNQSTGELKTNRVITIVDRSTVVRDEEIPSWMGSSPIRHVGWRFRPDNLWAMGPLANLVGLQYRIDHLENAKADAFDLTIHPPLKIIGEVEEFVWGPEQEIHIDENGDVQEVLKNLNSIITADNQIQFLEDKMELFAGAPREAMGVRTPGEKTLGEVTQLATAAGRIFQEKITNFEIELLEPNLNDMLETAARNMDTSDVIRVMDTDLGVEVFETITRDDIVANGKIRPVGARHFGKQAQDMQNLMQVMNSPIGQMIAPHTSGKELTKFVNDVGGLSGYSIFRPNVAIVEQQETQRMMNQASEDLELESQIPIEDGA